MFSITGTGPARPASDLCPSLYLRGVSNTLTETVGSCIFRKLLPGSPALPMSPPAGMTVGPDDPMGRLILIELPAGDYEFDRYSVTLAFGSGSISYNSAPSFYYKFTVMPGRVNYLGDLNFATWYPFGMQLSVLDRRARDARLLDAQLPTYGQEEKIWCNGCALSNP